MSLPLGGWKIKLSKCCVPPAFYALHSRMQLRQSQLKGERSVCPEDPNHAVHGNGSYLRLKNPDGDEKIRVPCWNCTECSNSFSVLPDDAVPYRSLSVGLLESGLDAAISGNDPPKLSENEKGCLKRACRSFFQNIPFLTNILGQIVKTTRPSAAELWQELREPGELKASHLYLAENFKTSLLKDYHCLSRVVPHSRVGIRWRRIQQRLQPLSHKTFPCCSGESSARLTHMKKLHDNKQQMVALTRFKAVNWIEVSAPE